MNGLTRAVVVARYSSSCVAVASPTPLAATAPTAWRTRAESPTDSDDQPPKPSATTFTSPAAMSDGTKTTVAPFGKLPLIGIVEEAQ